MPKILVKFNADGSYSNLRYEKEKADNLLTSSRCPKEGADNVYEVKENKGPIKRVLTKLGYSFLVYGITVKDFEYAQQIIKEKYNFVQSAVITNLYTDFARPLDVVFDKDSFTRFLVDLLSYNREFFRLENFLLNQGYISVITQQPVCSSPVYYRDNERAMILSYNNQYCIQYLAEPSQRPVTSLCNAIISQSLLNKLTTITDNQGHNYSSSLTLTAPNEAWVTTSFRGYVHKTIVSDFRLLGEKDEVFFNPYTNLLAVFCKAWETGKIIKVKFKSVTSPKTQLEFTWDTQKEFNFKFLELDSFSITLNFQEFPLEIIYGEQVQVLPLIFNEQDDTVEIRLIIHKGKYIHNDLSKQVQRTTNLFVSLRDIENLLYIEGYRKRENLLYENYEGHIVNLMPSDCGNCSTCNALDTLDCPNLTFRLSKALHIPEQHIEKHYLTPHRKMRMHKGEMGWSHA